MSSSIDYFFSVASPWAYLGAARLQRLQAEFSIPCRVYPVDLGRVFAQTGGVPYPQRSTARRQYRQLELARWGRKLGVPITLEPRFYPVDRQPASCLLIAAREQHPVAALRLSQMILRSIWADDGDISNWQTLRALAADAGFDAPQLLENAQTDAVAARFEADTDEAIRLGVFGSPSYVVDGEIFWGQDRLDFVREKLSAGRRAQQAAG